MKTTSDLFPSLKIERALYEKIRAGRLICLVLAFVMVYGYSLELAEAFQVKRVQQIHVSLGEEETEQSVNLPEAVDWSKTFLVHYGTTPVLEDSQKDYRKNLYGGEGDGAAAVFPESASTVKFRRGLSYKPVNSRMEAVFYAVEFKDGVRVHRGITQFDPDEYAKTMMIPTVDLKRSIPLVMSLSSDPVSNQNESFLFQAVLKNSEALRIERGSLPAQGRVYAPSYADVYWQVVEFDEGVSVRSGELKITNEKVSVKKVLPGIPLKSADHSALFFNYSAVGKARGDESRIVVRGFIEDKETLRFSRTRAGDRGAGVNILLNWYVLEFEEGTEAQRGTLAFEPGELIREVKINPVTVGCALPLVTTAFAQEAPPAEAAGELNPEPLTYSQSDLRVKAELIAPETLRLSRYDSPEHTESRIQAEWQVIEFAPFHLLTPKPGEVLRVQEPYDFVWSYADALGDVNSVPGSDLVDFSILYPSGKSPDRLPLVSAMPIREQAFRMIIPPEIQGSKTAGHPLRVFMNDRRAKPKTSVSRGAFAIKGRLKIIEPLGGTVWPRDGAGNVIRWEAIGIEGDIGIYYDDKGGRDERSFGSTRYISKIAAGANPVMTYLWDDMPDLYSRKMRIKVVQFSDPSVYSVSQDNFSVFPVIRITDPRYGETQWEAFSVKRVSWETNGTIPAFKLQFRTAKDQNWTDALSNISGGGAGEYGVAWSIPGEASGPETELRVVSLADDEVFGVYPREESAAFPVGPWIRLQGMPSEGVRFKTLDELDVRWDFAGKMGLVMIEYSTDGGRRWIKQAVAEASDQIYCWHFISFQAKQVLVRISDLERPEVRDVSKVPFEVE